MPHRGWFALNDTELANNARVVAHLGMQAPTEDIGYFSAAMSSLVEDPPGSHLYVPDSAESPAGSQYYAVSQYHMTIYENPTGSQLYTLSECDLIEESALLYEIPPTSVAVDGHPGLYTPPDGSVQYDPYLFEVLPQCWGPPRTCPGCRTIVGYDDSWPGLREWLDADSIYRIELAPWYTTRSPESAEFAGIWMTDVRGLDATPVSRSITELVGSGATAGPSRDPSRTISFEALLIGCTHAGLEYGLDWLACLLRETAEDSDSTLRYLNAHPSYSAADVDSLVREVHQVVYKTQLEIVEKISTRVDPYRQANIYKVTWEFAALTPYAWAPPIHLDLEWDEMQVQSIQWVHAPDCITQVKCQDIPILFSDTCAPETIEVVSEPPPSCGGCMPVCALETYVYHVPTLEFPLRCHQTAVSMTIRNMSSTSLTMQGYWRSCIADPECEKMLFPVQIAGLPAQSILTLDGVTGRYWAIHEDQAWPPERTQRRITPGLRGPKYKPVGIVGTPSGAPWTPPVIDREGCWEFVAITAADSDFEIKLALADREA